MTEGQILDIMRDAYYNTIICSAPPLLVSLVVGLIVSIFQTVTSIQEQTLTFVPKLLSILLILAVLGSTILARIQDFVYLVFNMIKTG